MRLLHKRMNHLIRCLTVMVLMILSVAVTAGKACADTTYDFAGLGPASAGFKAQGNRFLVSQLFEDDSAGGRPTAICYNTTGFGFPQTVNGIIIKADGTNLVSFDLKDMGFGIYPGGSDETITSLTITGTKVGGGTVTTTVAPGFRANGTTFSLVGLAGLDLSGFTNITQLQFDITTSSDVWDIDFMTITLANEVVASATPTLQATAVQTVVVGATELNLGWTNGNGSSRVIFAKEGATSGVPTVTDGTTYAANAVFSAATDSGSGWKSVYNGNGNSVSLSGLSASTQYRFVVFEYNGSSGNEKYLTSGANNALNQTTIASFGVWSSGRARTADLAADVQFAMADAELDSSGNTYVVHRADSSWTTEIQKWNGSSWAPLTSTTPAAGGYTSFSLTSSSYPFTNYRLAVTGVDNLRVATVAEKGTALNSQRGIIQATYDGSAWSFQDVAMFSDPNNYIRCERPVIAVDGAGNSHILYERLNHSVSGAYDQILQLASWNGSSWSNQIINTIISANSNNQVSPDYLLLNDAGNKQHIFYFVNTSSTTKDLHYWTNASGVVSDTTLLSGSTESPGGLHGALDGSGKLHVTYYINTLNSTAGYGVKYLTNKSGSWASSTLLAPGFGYFPLELRINGNGDMIIPVWNGSTNTLRTLLKQGSSLWSISSVSSVAAPEGSVSIGVTFRDDGMAMFAYSNDLSLTPRVLGYSLASLQNIVPTFVGSTTTLTVPENTSSTDIKSLLHVSDINVGQTETWSQYTAPDHGGTLSFSSATASSGSTDITPGGTITYQPANGYSGTETFTVQVNDGPATATRTITVTIIPPPAVTGISPTSGQAAGGTSVTITGTNLTGATAVTIGGTAATSIIVVNSTTITATTPAGTAGTQDVVVTTLGGTGTGTGLFTYIAPPTVTGISPTSGPAAGGTPVTITGTNFTGDTAVTIGGTAATSITVVNSTTITATTPAGTAGARDVVFTTPGGTGTGTGLFTYIAAPTVTGISPASGPAADSTSVTITGTNLTGATAVTIGGTAATGITVVNATTITATTPVGTAGARDVVVTTPGGSGTGTGLFTYIAAPTVSSISPTNGPTVGGTSVTITGTNFTGTTAVTIGGTAATGITVVNSTTIIATTPARTAGAKDVVVTTPGGSGTGTSLFTFKINQTITFTNPGAQTYGTTPTLTASADSSLAVLFSSVTTDICTITSGGALTLVTSGACTITADQSGDAGFIAAPQVQQSFTVNKATQAITLAATATKTYGAADFGTGATVPTGLPLTYSSDNEAVATVAADGLIHIVGAGEAIITASQAGDGNYNAASAQQTITVSNATITVTADNKSRAYGAADPAFTATYSGFAYGENNSVINGAPTFTTSADASSTEGSYNITPIVTGLSAANYNFTAAPGTLAVGIASQSITFNPLAAKTYGDATFDLSATGGASGNPVTFSSSNTSVATVSGTTVTIVGAGTTTIAADQAGTTGAYATATAQQTLTVNKATITVTAASATRPYNTANPTLTASYSGFVNNENAAVISGEPTVTTTATQTSPVGSYPVSANINTLTAANYNFNFVGGTLAVGLAGQSITFDVLANKTYGDATFDLSATGGASGNSVTFASSNEAVATVSGSTVTITGAGSAVITASQTGNNNYASATSQQTLTVAKAPLTVTPQDAIRAYAEANPTLIAGYNGFINNESATALQGAPALATSADNASAPGSYPITAAVGNLFSNNYSFSYVSGTLTVGKAVAVVALGNLGQSWDGTAKNVSVSTTPGTLGVGLTYNGSATAPTAAGSYTVVATVSDSNYQGTASGTLIITKATSGVTWAIPATITAGTQLSGTQLNATANVAGNFSYTPAAGTVLSAGTHTLTAAFTPSDGNYNGASASVALTVNAAPVVTDSTAPTVDSFTIPASATNLTVTISSFTASDATGVTGYLVSESATQPATDAVWSATAPTEYTFANQGNKAVYAFARDAAGNISVPLSALVTITMADITVPTVTSFTIPVTATSLIVPVTNFDATDDSGVTAWLLSQTSTTSAGDSNWSAIKPTGYTFVSQGAKTLYAFSKDSAGNVSAPLSAPVTITLDDTTPPTVDAVTIPGTASSLTVAINAISATDTGGVTGYFISESATPPAADATGWSSNAPTSYTFASQGDKTLYIFTKDAAGNVSLPTTAYVTITLSDSTAPSVTSFTLPATSASLTVAVSSFSASDDSGVTGYLLSETAVVTAGSGNWTTTPTSSYTFATGGSKTLYAFTKDAAGNVSSQLSVTVAISLPDTSAPTVSGFIVTGSSASLTVTVTNLTATDDIAVTGYIITESVTAPAAADSGWTSTPPASSTFATGGSKTLYAYAKDAAGNVSAAATTTVIVSTILRNGNGGSGADPAIADALKALQAYFGLVILSSDDQIRYDVAPLSTSGVPEGNGEVDFSDAIIILRRSIGIGSW